MTEQLDESAQHLLDMSNRSPARPIEAGTPLQARIDYNAGFPTVQGVREVVASVVDFPIAGPNGPIVLRVYRPEWHVPGVDHPFVEWETAC